MTGIEVVPNSPDAANAAGSNVYFTGVPCGRGHVAPRYARSGFCLECNRIKSRRARERNREKVNAAKRNYSRTHCANILLASAKRRSRALGVPFAIEIADIDITEVCPVLGIPLEVGEGRIHAGSPTLDRFDPAQGYVPGNVMVVSHRANLLKNNASVDELERVARWMRLRSMRS